MITFLIIVVWILSGIAGALIYDRIYNFSIDREFYIFVCFICGPITLCFEIVHSLFALIVELLSGFCWRVNNRIRIHSMKKK